MFELPKHIFYIVLIEQENVICGHLIPAGTGLRRWEKLIVGSREDYDRMEANRKNVLDYSQEGE